AEAPARPGPGAREAAGHGAPGSGAAGQVRQRGTGAVGGLGLPPRTAGGRLGQAPRATEGDLGQPPRGGSPGHGPGPVPTASGSAPEQPAEGGASPLRRRVRGATLQATTASTRLPREAVTTPNPRPPAWQTADAEAARSEIDEFEEAVLRAERESAAGYRGSGDGPDRSRSRPDTSTEHSTENNRPSFPEGTSK
ncbi:hypothetical protein ABZV34_15625, partial [Streptomyces sp. NPDC005195]